MHTRIFWIKSPSTAGKLGIMPHPRGDDWLEEEIFHMKENKVTTLVSLLENDEAMSLGLAQEQSLCEKNNIRFLNLAIPDFSVPSDSAKAIDIVRQINETLSGGGNVVIHCRGGIGRSGIIASCVLIAQGKTAREAMAAVSAARGMAVPETEAQVEWIVGFEKWVR